MLALKKIAVTGSLSSGKSTVTHFFEQLGAFVLDADQVVHDLISQNKDLQRKIIELLGTEILVNGQIDRKKIAEIVFKDPLLLSQLEKIIHPEVRKVIADKWLEISKLHKHSAFVVEIPLLFETQPQNDFDATVVVTAPEALCIERFKAKTGSNEKSYHQRMERQLPASEKAKRGDYVLNNQGDLSELLQATKEVYSKITT